jgi:predicted nucleic acid-binding protein
VIVVDASALAKYVLKEEGWREIRKVLEGGAVSVDHVVKEVSNAI